MRTLAPSAPNVAILPDDMMAVQELHTTREGIGWSESICPQCLTLEWGMVRRWVACGP